MAHTESALYLVSVKDQSNDRDSGWRWGGKCYCPRL